MLARVCRTAESWASLALDVELLELEAVLPELVAAVLVLAEEEAPWL